MHGIVYIIQGGQKSWNQVIVEKITKLKNLT